MNPLLEKLTIEELTIGTVNSCNLKCPLCMRQNPEFINDGKSLDYQRALKFIDRFPIKKVNLIGTLSEPLLYKNLIPFCEELKSRGIIIWISTNGSMLSSKFRKLNEILTKEDSVVFAIESYKQEEHQRYRLGSDLNNILHNVNLLSNTTTICQFIKFKYNTHSLEKTKSFAKENGFDKFYEIYTGFNDTKDFGLPFIYHTRTKLEIETKRLRPICRVYSDKLLYINHLNQLNLCDSYDEDLFSHDNPLTTESTDMEILNYYKKSTNKDCCYEYCGFKYPKQKDVMHDL